MGVEDARHPVLLEVRLAGHGVESHLVWLEERAHAVVVNLGDRVVLVVVALGAVHRQAEQSLARVLDRRVQPRRAIEEVVVSRQEAGAAYGVGIARIELVGREHLEHHAVVALVVVQRLDDPVSPAPDVLLAVAQLRAESVPVGVAPDVHPVAAPALAVPWAREQTIDNALPGIRARVVEEFALLPGRRGQTDQVEVDTAQQETAVLEGKRLDAVAPTLDVEEGVDRMRSLAVRLLRHPRRRAVGRCPARGAKRPVLLHGGLGLLVGRRRRAGHDPAAQAVDLLGRQRLALRRHALIRIRRRHPFDQQACLRLARLDGSAAAASRADRQGGVEPQPRLPLQRAVARVAARSQKRLDIAEVVHVGGDAPGPHRQTDQDDGQERRRLREPLAPRSGGFGGARHGGSIIRERPVGSETVSGTESPCKPGRRPRRGARRRLVAEIALGRLLLAVVRLRRGIGRDPGAPGRSPPPRISPGSGASAPSLDVPGGAIGVVRRGAACVRTRCLRGAPREDSGSPSPTSCSRRFRLDGVVWSGDRTSRCSPRLVSVTLARAHAGCERGTPSCRLDGRALA